MKKIHRSEFSQLDILTNLLKGKKNYFWKWAIRIKCEWEGGGDREIGDDRQTDRQTDRETIGTLIDDKQMTDDT